ncbi:MAG: nuclear transport factor 2 family protein [Tildeniella nuda ZEHNDER 1965/U140]|nr:nuclear transport factor 2 family protein [Tildeniella nuda ZEHNDER 1965/U140]
MKTNLEIVREFYKTLNSELVDPDVDWNVADSFSLGIHHHGRQAVQKWVTRLAAQFDNWKDMPDQLLDTGDMVIALGHYQGRSQVTGKPVDVPFSHIWFLKDGRIIKLNHHVDTVMLDGAIAPDKALQN